MIVIAVFIFWLVLSMKAKANDMGGKVGPPLILSFSPQGRNELLCFGVLKRN